MSQPMSASKLSLIHLKRLSRLTDGERPPLLLLLHGVGSNEQDLFTLAPQFDPRFVVLSVRAPLVWGPDSFAWFTVRFQGDQPIINAQELDASRTRLTNFISEAILAYNAHPARVYLFGFSQGAILSLTLALSVPRMLAGVVACAGRVPPEVLPWASPPGEISGLPVLLQHGREDVTLPIDWAHRARAMLEERGVVLTYHEYDVGHTLTAEMLADANAWLADREDGPPWYRH
jgi:phospholipase/carboxylesterase